MGPCGSSSWTPPPPSPHPIPLGCPLPTRFTLMPFIPLISFLDLLYCFGSTSSPTLSLFFLLVNCSCFQDAVSDHLLSSLYTVLVNLIYSHCFSSASERMTSKPMPWSLPCFQIGICIWIYYRCLKLYTPPRPCPNPCTQLLSALSPSIKPSGLADLDSPRLIFFITKKLLMEILKDSSFSALPAPGYFSFTTCFGPSFLLSRICRVLLCSLFTNTYHKYPAGTALTQADHELTVLEDKRQASFCVWYSSLFPSGPTTVSSLGSYQPPLNIFLDVISLLFLT